MASAIDAIFYPNRILTNLFLPSVLVIDSVMADDIQPVNAGTDADGAAG